MSGFLKTHLGIPIPLPQGYWMSDTRKRSLPPDQIMRGRSMFSLQLPEGNLIANTYKMKLPKGYWISPTFPSIPDDYMTSTTFEMHDPQGEFEPFSYLIDYNWRNVLNFYNPDNTCTRSLLEDDHVPVYPPVDLIFHAFNLTLLREIKVVILGQEPYHKEKQAMGLSFSVPYGVPIPRSLKKIYEELDRDDEIFFKKPDHGNLTVWAIRGVLLLNSILTTSDKDGTAASAAKEQERKEWQMFTDTVIQIISKECDHVVFLLWGQYAQKKRGLIDASKHKVIVTDHPSPQAAMSGTNPIVGSGCFSAANKALKNFGKTAIDWSIPSMQEIESFYCGM